jgi:hypothetical protein
VDVPHRDVVEEHLAGHLVVRVVVIRGHAPLVSKEDEDPAPVYPAYVVAGQDPVHSLRCGAACEHYGETPALLDGLLGLRSELERGGLGELF